MSCVREWWERSPESPTCPICRRNLYFRGMRHVVGDWQREDSYDEEELTDLCEFLLKLRRSFELPYVLLIPPPAPPHTGENLIIYWDTPELYSIVPRHQFRRIMLEHSKGCYKL
jgi:hypothetical protein